MIGKKFLNSNMLIEVSSLCAVEMQNYHLKMKGFIVHFLEDF